MELTSVINQLNGVTRASGDLPEDDKTDGPPDLGSYKRDGETGRVELSLPEPSDEDEDGDEQTKFLKFQVPIGCLSYLLVSALSIVGWESAKNLFEENPGPVETKRKVAVRQVDPEQERLNKELQERWWAEFNNPPKRINIRVGEGGELELVESVEDLKPFGKDDDQLTNQLEKAVTKEIRRILPVIIDIAAEKEMLNADEDAITLYSIPMREGKDVIVFYGSKNKVTNITIPPALLKELVEDKRTPSRGALIQKLRPLVKQPETKQQ